MIRRLLRRYLLEPLQFLYFAPIIMMVIVIPAFGIVFALPFFVVDILLLMRQPRASTFEASMPISAREFTTARALATLLLTWLTLAIWLVVWHIRAIHSYDQSAIYRFLGGSDHPNVRIATFIGAVSIVMLIPQLIRPRLLLPPPIWLLTLAILVFVSVTASAMWFLPPLIAFVLIFVGFIAAMYRVVRGRSESFQFSSLAMSRADAPSVVTRNAKSTEWLWPFVQSVSVPWLVASFAMMAFGGATGIWLTLFCIALGTSLTMTRARISWLRSLPISNRAQFLLMITPILLANVGGFVIGRIIGEPLLPSEIRSMNAWGPTKSTGKKYYESPTNISITYWQTTPKNSLPTITAPFGETAIADTISFFNKTFFNPYASSAVNTKRFVDWQIERASEVVYGARIRASQYNPEGPFPTRVTRMPRMSALNVSFALTFGLFLVFLGELARWRRVSNSMLWLNIAALPGVLIPLAVIVLDGLYRPGRSTQFIIPLTERFLLQHLRSLPANPILFLIVALLPVLAMYALAEWQFGKGETAPGRFKAKAGYAQQQPTQIAIAASALIP